MYYNNIVTVHRSALKHGSTVSDIMHVCNNPIVFLELEEGNRPKVLLIGADKSGNLLEVILLVLEQEQLLAVHAMKLRPSTRKLFSDLRGY